MRVVLWDTRQLDVSKDFAGGFGVGQFAAKGGLRERIIRYFFTRDRRPVALVFAHLAAAFQQLGHTVRYVEDRIAKDADLYVFCPALVTLHLERRAITQVLAANPSARVLVIGPLASLLPAAFEGLDVTLVKGEAEQLLWKLDDVLAHPRAVVQLGLIENLDRLPFPDWSLFRPSQFRISYDFWKFPTALIQHGRGCVFKCNYCPYIALDNSVRFRSPEAVVDEMRYDMAQWGFRSFKFRDPLFGADRRQLAQLVQLLERIDGRIQFSIETRIELMRPEILRMLKRVGLTSITVGVETPDGPTLRRYHRTGNPDEVNYEFVRRCREMGIRTVVGFMIGFPEDTRESVHRVLDYARWLNPTFANFNILTPYPGTEFFEQNRHQIADFDYRGYTVYRPVMKYQHLTAEELARLHSKCFRRFYFRGDYLRDNAPLLWPSLQWLGLGRPKRTISDADPAHAGPPRPLSGSDIIRLTHGLRQDGPHARPGITGNRQPGE